MLVKQHHAPLGLALAGEEFALNLGKAEQAVIGLDGFQDEPVTPGKAHRRWIICSLVPGYVLVFFLHARSIRDRKTFVSNVVRGGLDLLLTIQSQMLGSS